MYHYFTFLEHIVIINVKLFHGRDNIRFQEFTHVVLALYPCKIQDAVDIARQSSHILDHITDILIPVLLRQVVFQECLKI